MTLDTLHRLLVTHAQHTTHEYTRLFHGRGNTYGAYPFLTVDSIDKVLFVVLFDLDNEEELLLSMLNDLYTQEGKWEAFILQRRYLPSTPSMVLAGNLPQKTYAIEHGLKYHISFQNAQNIGFFPDMKIGREFVACHAQGKKVLNLFAYTCAFSVVALTAGAMSVVNVDMNKNVLSLGRENHRLNGVETKNVQFMPYNILTSWSRIRKAGPYDLIIIDPPSFQKGSFAATHDYVKIIRRLHELAAQECIVLSALNAPELGSDFIKTLFNENAPEFYYVKRLENLPTFPDIETERGLKNLVFSRGVFSPNIITYRTATIEDIPILCGLLYQLFSKEIEFTPNSTQQTRGLKKIIENEHIGEIYVALQNNKIVGMVNLLYTVSTALGERVAWLEDMVIDEKHRGKKIGSPFLQYVLMRTKEKGIVRVTLLTDADNLLAHPFYKGMGFSQSSMIPFRMQL